MTEAALAREERLHEESEALLTGRLGADAARMGLAKMRANRKMLDGAVWNQAAADNVHCAG